MDPIAAGPHPTPAGGADALDARDRNVGLGCAALLLIGMPAAYLPGDTQMTALIVTCAVSLAVMAAALVWLVPRERAAGRTNRTALILGVAAVVVALVFWTGIPFAIGAGAIALGLTGTDRRARVGLGLGVFAVVATFVLLLLG